jgi:hypothetical protein
LSGMTHLSVCSRRIVYNRGSNLANEKDSIGT